MKSSEVLRAALERMDGGKNWTQKGWFWELRDGQTLDSPTVERKCCSVGALIDLGDNLDARCFLIKAISPAIVTDWNDSAADFSVIEKGFRAAIELAIAEGD